MNRLKNTRVYLCGAMDRVPDGGTAWRDQITPLLEDKGVIIINPCKKPIDVGIEDSVAREKIEKYKRDGDFDKIRSEFGVIRTVDLRCVDISDFIIVNIDINTHACGTYEEITVANRQKKPILIWCTQGKEYTPNWLFFMLPHQHVFGNLEDLIHYLNDIDTCEGEIDHCKRWFFFNQKFKKSDTQV